jgi:hypothetical protein
LRALSMLVHQRRSLLLAHGRPISPAGHSAFAVAFSSPHREMT